jgi:RNA polymerase sigma-70 factor (ECF subfamily)
MDQFETYRPLMFSIAYRMLGSAMEAEDIVQEAYLRYQTVSPDSIESHKAFLTTMVTRLCINVLQSSRAKRETYLGPWLPEPILTGESNFPSPASVVSIHESISMAFLVLLESLTPVERAVFLLREVFDYEYAEIAEIVGKEEAACRQLFSRAKKHIAEHRPRFKPSPDEHRQMLERFVQATGEGNLEGLVQMLADDVTLWTDGGGKARGAATRPLYGREAVAQFIMASVRFAGTDFRFEIEIVNGEPTLVIRVDDRTLSVISIGMEQGKIHQLWVVGNPDKLKHV